MPAEASGPSDAIEAALTDLIAVLTRADIPYVLIGGLATGYRSRPRYTKDIDLILDIPQIALPVVLDSLAAVWASSSTNGKSSRNSRGITWRCSGVTECESTG